MRNRTGRRTRARKKEAFCVPGDWCVRPGIVVRRAPPCWRPSWRVFSRARQRASRPVPSGPFAWLYDVSLCAASEWSVLAGTRPPNSRARVFLLPSPQKARRRNWAVGPAPNRCRAPRKAPAAGRRVALVKLGPDSRCGACPSYARRRAGVPRGKVRRAGGEVQYASRAPSRRREVRARGRRTVGNPRLSPPRFPPARLNPAFAQPSAPTQHTRRTSRTLLRRAFVTKPVVTRPLTLVVPTRSGSLGSSLAHPENVSWPRVQKREARPAAV